MRCLLCQGAMERGVTCGICATCVTRNILNAKYPIEKVHSRTQYAAAAAKLPPEDPLADYGTSSDVVFRDELPRFTLSKEFLISRSFRGSKIVAPDSVRERSGTTGSSFGAGTSVGNLQTSQVSSPFLIHSCSCVRCRVHRSALSLLLTMLLFDGNLVVPQPAAERAQEGKRFALALCSAQRVVANPLPSSLTHSLSHFVCARKQRLPWRKNTVSNGANIPNAVSV